MLTPVSSIRNLGPRSEEVMAKAGINSAEELRKMGADTAYARLIASGERPHFIGYYALVMGLAGRPWNDCKGEEKAALRQRFDSIVAQGAVAPDLSTLDLELDRIGTGPEKHRQHPLPKPSATARAYYPTSSRPEKK